MPNTFGTLASSGLLYDALGITLKKLPWLKRMASDISPVGAAIGMPFNVAQVLKNWNAPQTVADRATTGNYDPVAGLVLPANGAFTLNKWPFVSISLSAIEVNQLVMGADQGAELRAAAIAKLMKRGFNALALNIVNDFFATFTAANFGQTYVCPVGTMDYKKLGSAVDVLLANDGLMEKPDAILEMACYREFVNSLSPIPNYSGVDEVVREATISEPVSGANSVSRYNIAMNAAAPRGILFDSTAVVMANRPPIEETLQGNDPVFLEVITDPDTGFSILYREFKNGSTGEVTRNITTMYGFGLGLSNHLVRITTA